MVLTTSIPLGYKQQSRKENGKVKDSEMFLWHNSGKWKERWFMISDSCLVVYKDSLHESADFALDISNCRLDVPEENTEQGFLSFKVRPLQLYLSLLLFISFTFALP